MDKIRRIDDLGRVVIPKEMRKVLGIREGDPLKINVDTIKGQVVIEKYKSELEKRCNQCKRYINESYEEGSEEGTYYHPECWIKAIMEGYDNHY